jgi:hypothetical protein
MQYTRATDPQPLLVRSECYPCTRQTTTGLYGTRYRSLLASPISTDSTIEYCSAISPIVIQVLVIAGQVGYNRALTPA